ncbi:MAG TPA: TMEM175 family protein [Gemmatimonadales bacterium]|jgi:uncharacterized membrane protein|nr:TMEM175 family protein [Gemmatimonadales bacterium]
MSKGRIEAFSDAVIAIAITIMVLELKVPDGADWRALTADTSALLAYVLSFVFLGIYWNNHHHMLQVTQRIDGAILWANLHLLFWLSLIPFATHWLAQQYTAAAPTVFYGAILLCSGISYTILQTTIIRSEGAASRLAQAVQNDVKGRLSLMLYVAALGLAFVRPWISDAIFVTVAVMWIVPDRRIERLTAER